MEWIIHDIIIIAIIVIYCNIQVPRKINLILDEQYEFELDETDEPED